MKVSSQLSQQAKIVHHVFTNAQERIFIPERADGRPRTVRLELSREPLKQKLNPEPPSTAGFGRVVVRAERCSALRFLQPGGLQEISRGLSAATPPVSVRKCPAPRRGARATMAARRVHGSGIPAGCGTTDGVTGGIVAHRAPQPPANFWQPFRLRNSASGCHSSFIIRHSELDHPRFHETRLRKL